ncbi:hypothetical protein Chor_010407 [Crotalus horridus]
MSLGAFCNFSTEATGVSQIFPGIRPYVTTLTGNFRWPILRDYLMTGGLCPVNRNTIDYLLSQNGIGNAVVIVVGGRGGVLELYPGKKLCDAEAPQGPITVPKTDNPSQKEIDFYHNLYVQSLVKLFDKYKAKFGLTEKETLEIN